MNNLHLTPLAIYVFCGCAAVAAALGCHLAVRARRLARDLQAVAAGHKAELAALSRDLEAHKQRSDLQARRVAWLEARTRGSVQAAPTPADEPLTDARVVAAEITPTIDLHAFAPQTSKPNMTERRHRVLKLRQRGQDARAIAATLGMARGEVELILGLTAA